VTGTRASTVASSAGTKGSAAATPAAKTAAGKIAATSQKRKLGREPCCVNHSETCFVHIVAHLDRKEWRAWLDPRPPASQ
jgi:hypothetical protein